jgi:nucleoid-associated protein YgaU
MAVRKSRKTLVILDVDPVEYPTAKKRKQKQKKPPGKRAPVSDGVVVAIGPAGGRHDNDSFKEWTTFPLTPGSIPISNSGIWGDGQNVIAGGERATFGGAQLATIQFSGQLEPPQRYISGRQLRKLADREVGGHNFVDAIPTGRADDDKVEVLESILGGGEIGKVLDPDREFALGAKTTTSGRAPAIPPPTMKGGTNVVMQPGGVAGGTYHEPHIFKELLTDACEDGEVVRLIVGDEFGWNGLVTIRQFDWRYEDPDPDTLLFDITFREHREHRLLSTVRQTSRSRSKKKPASIVTKKGDTLHRIAQRELKDASDWRALIRLNVRTLQELWVYKDEDQPTGATVGRKIRGRQGGHKVGRIEHPGSIGSFNIDRPFREGVRLKLRAQRRKKGSKK